MNKLILGIDNGSQSTKVSIFDTRGNEICFASHLLKETLSPEPGIVLHPDNDLWDSTYKALKKCLHKFTGNKKDIVGIGLCTIRCCRVLLKKDCSLAYPVMSWMDARLSDVYKHEDPEVAYVVSTSGYLAFHLTGEKKDAVSNLECYWPIDMETLKWSKDDTRIADHGLTRDMLFELVKPAEKYGTLEPKLATELGLSDDIPVVASANDKAVEAFGAGIKDDASIMISLGTFISAMMSNKKYFKNAKNFFSTLACIPFQYVYESAGIRRGMWTISWFKKIIGEELCAKAKELNMSEEDYLNMIGEEVHPGSDGLMIILDWLASPSTPYRKGMMIGFDQRHTKAHIFRAMLEGIVFTLKANIDDMLEETNDTINSIVVIGGGAKSNLIMQIIADVFGLPTHRNKVTSSACLGAAMCACVYLGIYDSFEKAIDQMVRVKDCFEPNTDLYKFYNNINDSIIKNIRKHTDEILKVSYPIFQ